MTVTTAENLSLAEPLFTYDPNVECGMIDPATEKLTIVSLFAGAGGLDLGFKKAGFRTIWANEYDKSIAPSFRDYFKDVTLDTRSITEIDDSEVPFADGIIGGPPCQR